MSNSIRNELNIVWWNIGNFFHFQKDKIGGAKSRWPKSQEEFDLKLDFTASAIDELITISGAPDIFFLCEITAEALISLRNRSFPTYDFISLDVKKDAPTLQVAVLYNSNTSNVVFVEQPPITVPSTPGGTRPMIVVDAIINGYTIRLVGCHWQSRFDEVGSDRIRFRLADHLSKYTYGFLMSNLGKHHVVVLGDLNEEPFEANLGTLFAHRHRAKSQARFHKADHDTQRAHLYNTSWRLLGEKLSHPNNSNPAVFENCAGTYYWESARSWHHFDHLIVSGGLLGNSVPYLDEGKLHILSSARFLTNGVPLKFQKKDGRYIGLSDHLPLVAKICIQKGVS